MDWLGKLLDLPEAFLSTSGNGGGVIQGVTCTGPRFWPLQAIIACAHVCPHAARSAE